MIHIEKDTDVIENPNLKVATATGDYEDSALIEVYNTSTPDVIAGAFQAQYIKYGSMVYGFNSHMELGAAILKLDPQSTHTSASYVRMSRELLAQMNGGSLESTSLNDVIQEEKKSVEEKIDEVPKTPEELPKEVPPEVPVVETPTEVAPPEVIPEEVPVVEGEVLGESVTPEVLPPPVVEEIVPEVPPPTIIEEIIEEVIPAVEDMLPEPVAKLIRKTKTLAKAKKAKKAKKIA